MFLNICLKSAFFYIFGGTFRRLRPEFNVKKFASYNLKVSLKELAVLTLQNLRKTRGQQNVALANAANSTALENANPAVSSVVQS